MQNTSTPLLATVPLTCMYIDDHQQQNQNDNDINEYHEDIHDISQQEPPDDLPTHEPMDFTHQHPPPPKTSNMMTRMNSSKADY